MEADERITSALARLTDNEKECLRRRLLPQTAKEMAIDLGISPHAVEKRLKMARAKLGLASSLDAARTLVASEGYGRAGPKASDLAEPSQSVNDPDAAGISSQNTGPIARRIRPAFLWGIISMILFAIGLLSLISQEGAPAPRQQIAWGADTTLSRATKLEDSKLRPATRAEIRSRRSDAFDLLDTNHSGFIERDEAPVLEISLGKAQPAATGPSKGWAITQVTGKGLATWIAAMDTNGDGMVSKEEFVAGDSPYIPVRGKRPVNPAATH